MDRHYSRPTRRVLPLLMSLAACTTAGCRSSDRPGTGERPTPPAARANAFAASDATARSDVDGAPPEPETRAGMGLEAVRAAVRGLVMLQETIGELAALRTLLPQDPARPAPDATAVLAALERLRTLARMEATGATALGLDDVAPLLEQAARDAGRWTDQLAATLAATDDDGTGLAARLAELPERLRTADDELRAGREARRTALEAGLPALSPADRGRAACLAAAADALYAWDLARLELETQVRAAAARPAEPPGDAGAPMPAATPEALARAVVLARTAATTWRDFLDSGYPLDESSTPEAMPPAADAARATDVAAREPCRGMTINALPPPGEDLPGLPAAAGPRRR